MNTKSVEFSTPISFLIAKWWGYLLSAMFLLYGGFRILFAVLDRDAQAHTGQRFTIFEPILVLGVGAILCMIAYEFGQGKKWGWLALLSTNALIVGLAVAQLLGFGGGLSQSVEAKQYDLILLILSVLAGVAVLMPSTQRIFAPSKG